MGMMIEAETIAELQDRWTTRWHEIESEPVAEQDPMALVFGNHRANFKLWHEEDKARDPSASDAQIAAVKRSIDLLNQRRNDVLERIDEMLLRASPIASADALLHSETPGMMIDRMSILALKIFHTKEQMGRGEASQAHRDHSAERLRILEEQRSDLVRCLSALWSAVLGGERRFKIYRQMKMYNDPELNPMIYGSRSIRSSS